MLYCYLGISYTLLSYEPLNIPTSTTFNLFLYRLKNYPRLPSSSSLCTSTHLCNSLPNQLSWFFAHLLLSPMFTSLAFTPSPSLPCFLPSKILTSSLLTYFFILLSILKPSCLLISLPLFLNNVVPASSSLLLYLSHYFPSLLLTFLHPSLLLTRPPTYHSISLFSLVLPHIFTLLPISPVAVTFRA